MTTSTERLAGQARATGERAERLGRQAEKLARTSIRIHEVFVDDDYGQKGDVS